MPRDESQVGIRAFVTHKIWSPGLLQVRINDTEHPPNFIPIAVQAGFEVFFGMVL